MNVEIHICICVYYIRICQLHVKQIMCSAILTSILLKLHLSIFLQGCQNVNENILLTRLYILQNISASKTAESIHIIFNRQAKTCGYIVSL